MPLSRIVKASRVATEPFKRWRITRGDKVGGVRRPASVPPVTARWATRESQVQIVGGRKDLGKQGVVKRVNRERSTVIVAGLNMVRGGVGASGSCARGA